MRYLILSKSITGVSFDTKSVCLFVCSYRPYIILLVIVYLLYIATHSLYLINSTDYKPDTMVEDKSDERFFSLAVKQAYASYEEGGIPIGAVLVTTDGKVIGSGRNERVQKRSAILHAEMEAIENARELPAACLKGSTMYTTLSPCDMCTGACLLYGISRVVLGENHTYLGGEQLLKDKGVEVKNMNNDECRKLIQNYAASHPEIWNEQAWS